MLNGNNSLNDFKYVIAPCVHIYLNENATIILKSMIVIEYELFSVFLDLMKTGLLNYYVELSLIVISVFTYVYLYTLYFYILCV